MVSSRIFFLLKSLFLVSPKKLNIFIKIKIIYINNINIIIYIYLLSYFRLLNLDYFVINAIHQLWMPMIVFYASKKRTKSPKQLHLPIGGVHSTRIGTGWKSKGKCRTMVEIERLESATTSQRADTSKIC